MNSNAVLKNIGFLSFLQDIGFFPNKENNLYREISNSSFI